MKTDHSGKRGFNRRLGIGVIALSTAAIIIGLSVGLTGNAEIEEENSGGESPSDPWFPNPESIGGLNSPYRYDCLSEVECTPLDEYVWRDDKDYRFSETVAYGSLIGPRPVKTFVMNMTSQNWLTEEDVTRTEWFHEVVIALPKKIHPSFSKSCVMLIDGGSNRHGILGEDSAAVKGATIVAHSMNSCVAVLRQVPNQRLYFKNDPRKGESGRSEDDIIAWTWKHFLLYPNQPDWLLRLPMTKAARLAMDTINSKIQEERKKNRQWEEQFASVIDEFTIMGASKRGWTTWTIAAVDKRVKAAIPMVLDCLNMKQIFSDWFANMGAWSFALEPYYSEGLTAYFDDPGFERLASVVDPYTYRDRLTMPKMVISATGDEFFNPDDSYAWFDDMKGKTYMRLLPNAEHGMIPPQGLSSPSIAHGIRSFYMSVQKDYPLPEISWERYVDDRNYSVIILQSETQPKLVNAWTADTRNSTRRDWRWAKMRDEYIDWSQEDAELKNIVVTNTRHASADETTCDSDIIRFLDDRTLEETCKSLQKYSKVRLEPYSDITGEMIEFQPIKWNQIRVETLNATSWYAEIPPTSNGFRALMIEVTFQGPDDKSGLTFTTEVMITPDVRPFKRCKGAACYSFLI